MTQDRSDLDIPAGTVWPATEELAAEQPATEQPAAEQPATEQPAAKEGDVADSETPIELGPGTEAPLSLDPDRDDAERNAAAGGWDGANEQIENDFEAEQLRRAQQDDETVEDVPLT